MIFVMYIDVSILLGFVETTLFLGSFLPPPSAFSFMLIRQSGFGAGLTPNAKETTEMQLTERYVESSDIPPDFLRACMA